MSNINRRVRMPEQDGSKVASDIFPLAYQELRRLAAFGNEGVIVGALDDTGETGAASAYWFSVPAPPGMPSLTIFARS